MLQPHDPGCVSSAKPIMSARGNLMLCTLLIAPIAIVLGAAVLQEALPLRPYAGFGLLAVGLIVLDGRLLKPRQYRARRT